MNLRQIIGQDFEQYNAMQLLCTQDVEPQAKLENIINPAADDTNSDAATASDNQPQDPDRLSAIPEEDEQDIDLDALAHEAFFNIKEKAMRSLRRLPIDPLTKGSMYRMPSTTSQRTQIPAL